MLDDIIKTIVNEKIAELNTTMTCTVTSLSPLSVQPIQAKQYITGAVDYPVIQGVKKLKQHSLVEGSPVSFDLPLSVGSVVLVAFGKKELTDAVILGVIG